MGSDHKRKRNAPIGRILYTCPMDMQATIQLG